MRRIILALLSGILFLTACGQTSSTTPTAFISIVDTATPSPVPTSTQTSIPIETPTTSITPLPTIPTFTPTFDARTIVTVTPAPKAECPQIDSTIKPEDFLPTKLEYPTPDVTNKVLEFLNKGGDGQALIARLEKVYPDGGQYRGAYGFYDVTGDHIPEFLFVELNYDGKPVVLSCQNGRYELLATLSGKHESNDYTFQTDDLNMDGIPAIIVTGTGGVSFPQSIIYIYKWDGQTFSILGQVSILALRQIQIKDTDGNGTKEIILIGDNPGCTSCFTFIPQRQRTITYGWNGNSFVEISNEFTSPEYRFQAIQDADAAVIIGQYDIAMKLYEEAISNQGLKWWSPDRMLYEQDAYRWIPGITPVAMPEEDKTEYPRLAAYAYYRIMLLHLVQGHEPDATTVYNTLQEKFGNNQYGRPYAEMATEFWNALMAARRQLITRSNIPKS